MRSELVKFQEWIKEAPVGKFYIYHTGRLDVDRGMCLDKLFVANGETDAIGNEAYQAFTDKKVYLFQRKLHDNEYQYIAVKRSPYGRNW